jgi:hypothetical protein
MTNPMLIGGLYLTQIFAFSKIVEASQTTHKFNKIKMFLIAMFVYFTSL